MNSINSTELLLQDYHVTNASKASFTVYNPGPGDTYAISNLTVADDGLWHKCQGSLPWQLVACEYFLDRATSNVGFRLQWYCDDRDPYNAYARLSLGSCVTPVQGTDFPTVLSFPRMLRVR